MVRMMQYGQQMLRQVGRETWCCIRIHQAMIACGTQTHPLYCNQVLSMRTGRYSIPRDSSLSLIMPHYKSITKYYPQTNRLTTKYAPHVTPIWIVCPRDMIMSISEMAFMPRGSRIIIVAIICTIRAPQRHALHMFIAKKFGIMKICFFCQSHRKPIAANMHKTIGERLRIIICYFKYRFSQEFDSSDEVTLKITVMPNREGDKINLTVNGYHQMISNTSDLFTESIEWIWIEWDINFDYIRIGNAQYIGRKQLYEPKYTWTAYRGKCYGQIVVQFPPLSKQTPKGCYENYTHVFAQPEPADGNTMNLFIEYPSPGTPSPVVTITSTAMETTITSDHETSQSNETIIGSETITETETDKEESGEGGGAKTDDGTGAAVGISVGAVALIGLAGYRVYKVRKGQNTAVDSDNGHNEVELANAIAPAAAVQTAETTEADDDDLVHL
eukprot:125389_1